MYCKQCGHRTEEKGETCPKCGAKFATTRESAAPAPKAKVRLQVPAATAIIGVLLFVVVPRVFLRADPELIEPTTKLRFLRALTHSDNRRIGQRDVRVEGQTLLITWDLTWNTLLETKQQEIVHNIGRAWEVVGGEDTHVLIEGEDGIVASYAKGEIHLSSP
jgi:hypothetical protein